LSFTIKIARQADACAVHLEGPIDETAGVQLISLLDLDAPEVVINFRKVVSVSSNGVRAWLNFLRSFQEGRRIVFEECSPSVVSQIAMIGSFRGRASVRSLCAVGRCPSCNLERTTPVTSTAELSRLAPCTRCRTPLEIDNADEIASLVPALLARRGSSSPAQ
jgi:anti-anti-sigma regulatory factor